MGYPTIKWAHDRWRHVIPEGAVRQYGRLSTEAYLLNRNTRVKVSTHCHAACRNAFEIAKFVSKNPQEIKDTLFRHVMLSS